MNYNEVSFKAAYGTINQLPKSVRPEISFAGRSNVGKSSLLNKLFNRKGLAKVSSTPGKTATINFFTASSADFVDLPGYGYAKVSKTERQRWSGLIEGYFHQDRRFALVVSLIDIRHAASELDVQMIDFLMEEGLPFVVVLTKADKLSKSQVNRQVAAIRKQLGFEPEDPIIAVSSEKGTGIDVLKRTIEYAIQEEKKEFRG
ncbi:ribosome biogenesis GTP-binding protein YihA/YsxC [Slackia heliotrinireducens]|jgi:GTP-binding protein|uniref:Probable GTP-binding protein EngB n=1 Tax=Slackia heliotrinireducens (strain ATCC 29202 / DSM 20476 / NCTC 11029 / RHS 1) TaxID=471855 RepID=C7N578_SLAHD|nr:ribosome biogenesis GTP-binding protein YihA/YsxC [Slackia heliotrinireducens]ACV22063.1 small GTP-binding protein domain/GTP-binding conserved hypothetical protein [Slackia heliotrinireducens DSM 20476]VEH00030.1 Probable GTP-binding protein EngB [Slackia heliotrinireducens]